ncbi:MAG: type II toxin-antitoxin system HicB family antitoxin [bacterium]|nr:type II toxin-antitoxin system HicB family antitoxin [bacterium]
MKYTVVLTEKTDGNIHVTVPGLPDCDVEAPTRDEALDKIRESITTVVKQSEILQLDIFTEPKSNGLRVDTPWEWFGKFKGNPVWDQVFDDIEQQRK